jgi:hypothetical protein
MKGWNKPKHDRAADLIAHARFRAKLKGKELDDLARALAPLVADLLKKGGKDEGTA